MLDWALIAVFAFAAWLHGYSKGALSVQKRTEMALIESAIARAEQDTRNAHLIEVE